MRDREQVIDRRIDNIVLGYDNKYSLSSPTSAPVGIIMGCALRVSFVLGCFLGGSFCVVEQPPIAQTVVHTIPSIANLLSCYTAGGGSSIDFKGDYNELFGCVVAQSHLCAIKSETGIYWS